MKKIISLILCIVLSSAALTLSASALGEDEISAPSAILMDQSSGTVLFEKNPDEKRACASVTKIMTLLLVMEALDSGKITLDDIVTTSPHASSMGGSDIWLEPGETMTVDEMLRATVIASANDAAVALAEYISGTEETFVDLMNKRAAELGMKNTVFKNCNGLDEEGHLTSARDVAIMSRELLRHPTILKYSGTRIDELRGGKTQIVNTNKLLRNYSGITGLKTGTTSKAGACISATAEREGLSLIAVVLGAPSGKERFSDASKLLDMGFAEYEMYTPQIPDNMPETASAAKGMSDTVKISAIPDQKTLIKKGKKSKVVSEIKLPESVEAPIEKGQQIGKIVYSLNDKKLTEIPIKADENIEKISFRRVFAALMRELLCIAQPSASSERETIS